MGRLSGLALPFSTIPGVTDILVRLGSPDERLGLWNRIYSEEYGVHSLEVCEEVRATNLYKIVGGRYLRSRRLVTYLCLIGMKY